MSFITVLILAGMGFGTGFKLKEKQCLEQHQEKPIAITQENK